MAPPPPPLTPMWREAVLAALVLHLARVPNPDRREESHVGATLVLDDE